MKKWNYPIGKRGNVVLRKVPNLRKTQLSDKVVLSLRTTRITCPDFCPSGEILVSGGRGGLEGLNFVAGCGVGLEGLTLIGG